MYSISVAAELSGIGEQTLRMYEKRGLLTPARTAGGTRRYSDDDLARLQRISELVAIGVNVTGIGEILGLEASNARLESDNAQLVSNNAQLVSDNARLESNNAQLESDNARLASGHRIEVAPRHRPQTREREGRDED
ncbi:MerR family transcriptional regulator [Mycobacterium kyorinense]|uniref:MerR family transcriptional regulator n=1 Tax=Mycobacterium kyorinense TaxID=487514 RepID=A0A1A2Z809_9MYCO|nr:MerR family transcriptional regulator [Mycobacterium kyorinense]